MNCSFMIVRVELFPIFFQLKRLDNCVGLCHEIEDATRAVHSLGALLFEMEVIRSYIETYEVPYFDARLAPAHISALKLTSKLRGKSPYLLTLCGVSCGLVLGSITWNKCDSRNISSSFYSESSLHTF